MHPQHTPSSIDGLDESELLAVQCLYQLETSKKEVDDSPVVRLYQKPTVYLPEPVKRLREKICAAILENEKAEIPEGCVDLFDYMTDLTHVSDLELYQGIYKMAHRTKDYKGFVFLQNWHIHRFTLELATRMIDRKGKTYLVLIY